MDATTIEGTTVGRMEIDGSLRNKELAGFLKAKPSTELSTIEIADSLKASVMEHYNLWTRTGNEMELVKVRSILSADSLPAPIFQSYGPDCIGIIDGWHRLIAYVLAGRTTILGYMG